MEPTRKNKTQTCSTCSGTEMEHGTINAPVFPPCSTSVPFRVEQTSAPFLGELLESLAYSGITLVAQGESLKLKCATKPADALLERIRANKAALLDYLHGRPPPNPFLKLARGFLDWRDEKGRLEAVPSELRACIIGLQSDPSQEAKELVQEMEGSMKAAKNALNRYKTKLRRRLKYRGGSKMKPSPATTPRKAPASVTRRNTRQ